MVHTNRPPTINCVLQPSKIFLMVNVLFFGALYFLWTILSFNWLFSVGGAIILFALLTYTVWRHILMASTQSWIGFSAQESPHWVLVSKAGKICQAILRKDSCIYPGFIALRFNVADRYLPVTIALFNDSLMPEDLRRLKVLLSWSVSKL